jgi:hypothetical protein
MRKRVKWGLSVHTIVMFSFTTAGAAIDRNFISLSLIDNRGFPGIGATPPGPLGYLSLAATDGRSALLHIIFPLNQWLADGLLVSSFDLSSKVSHEDRSCSCIAAGLFIPRITGRLPSRAYGTLPPSVRS